MKGAEKGKQSHRVCLVWIQAPELACSHIGRVRARSGHWPCVVHQPSCASPNSL